MARTWYRLVCGDYEVEAAGPVSGATPAELVAMARSDGVGGDVVFRVERLRRVVVGRVAEHVGYITGAGNFSEA
jgi:hypothetical protein